LKPEKSKVVLGLTITGNEVVVYQSPEHPSAYRLNKYVRGYITSMLASGVDVIIATGAERKILRSAVNKLPELVDISLHRS
jgi:hypothetical protein